MPILSIDDQTLRALVPMQAAVEAVKQAFAGLERGEFELPLRSHLGGGQSIVMPLFHRPTNSSVTKVLSLDPDRNPFITGTVTWGAKGLEHSVVTNAVPVTTIRTGAIVGAAVDLLAENDVEHLVVFGAGAQAFDQVRAVLAVRDIRRVSLVDRVAAKAVAAAETLKAEFPGAHIAGLDQASDVLPTADVICCATTSTTPLFSERDIAARVVVTAIGSYRPDMHELPQDLLASGCPVFVDNIEACMTEAGEIVAALRSGTLTADDLIPLGKAVLVPPPRTDRSVFKSVGVAVQDWAVMKVLSDAVKSKP